MFERAIIINLVIAVLYLLTGYLGLLLAAPPGYATPIWIPSGIALSAALIYGLRVLPGVFIGSLITNYFVTMRISNETDLFMALMLGVIIAAGATLQTWFGRWIIDKTVGADNALIYPNDILLFAFLSGPISCLVNATWSDTALLLLNILKPENYYFSWITWWVGDSMGVLIITPLVLILLAKPEKIWRKRIVPIVFPLLLSFIILTITYFVNYTYHLNTQTNLEYSWQTWSLLVCGLLFCVLINITLFITYGQKWLAQVDSRKKSRALKNTEFLNISILKSAGEGIYGVDNNGLLTFINPKAAMMLGYDDNELIGKYIHTLIHHSHPDGSHYPASNCPIYASSNDNKVHHVTDEVFWRKDGTPFWVEYTATPLKEGDHTNGAVVIFNDVSERREMELELKRMAHFDLLTGLPNRGSFFEHLTLALARANERHQSIAVCFIDIDNFKQINDTLGHNIGDEALKATANILKAQLQANNYFARLGGDEFAIIIENVHSKDAINFAMERIIRAFKKPIRIGGADLNLSISIGIALYPHAGTNSEEMIINADIAMYHAKDLGKGTYAFFNDEINRQVKRRHEIDKKIRLALERNELTLSYQYLVDSYTMKPIGVEALLRWHNDELGEVSPKEFIMIAEANSSLYQIGHWVLHQACADYKKIVKAGQNQNLFLAINVSISQLKHPSFFETVKHVLRDTEIKPENLILEITETALIQNAQVAFKMMNELKTLGIRFSLDDFGVSYSSMQYLKNLPISFIKIDKIFTDDINNNKSDVEIVQATIQLSHGMGIHTIAEGVETKQQLDLLKKMGCEYFQGYYYSLPVPLKTLLIQANKTKY